MAKLFPFRPESGHESAGPRLVNMDDEVADDVFAALSSDTAREILSRLYEDPATASDVAEAADTSLQNARYHLEKLESAGLIEPVDTWYSSRGTEMTVYAPTNEPLVVAAGREESKGVLRSALERVVGAVTVLAFASVVVDRLVRRFGGPASMFSAGEGAVPAGADDSANLSGTVTSAETVADQGGAETIEEVETVAAEAETVASTSTETALEADAGTVTDAPAATPTGPGTETGTAVYEVTEEAADAETVMETTTPSPESTPVPEGTTETVAQRVTDTATGPHTAFGQSGGIDLLSGVPPGGLFFAGGLLVVLLVLAWWYWDQYRPMYG